MISNPLNIVLNPSTGQQVYPGSNTELSLVITNQGKQGMIVETYLELPTPLKSWCKISRESFNLATGQSQGVNFQWRVPEQTLPNNYHYDVVIDSPLLSAPLRYTLTFEVLTPLQKAVRSIDPTFGITPTTSSTKPLKLENSQPLIIQALVHNRSNRVDDFRLNCPDLDENWYKVRYPEGVGQLGVVSGGDKLSLNPGAKGQITLQLHPPADALAGNYSPTLHLFSTVNPTLSLQEIFYFNLPPRYQLQVQLQVILDRISKTPGLYEIQLENQGNTIREIKAQVETAEELECCNYLLEPPQIKIPPGKTKTIQVAVTPVQKLQQPFWGTAKSLRFRVNLQDLNQYPLPRQLPLQGTLYWKPRPLWQFLLILLAGILGVGSVAFLLWWLFFKTIAPPEVISFESAEPSYHFSENVRLNWKIGNAQRLNSLTIIAKDSKGKEQIEPITLNMEQLPSQCQKDEEYLNCQNFSTGAQQPGEYLFTLSLFTNGDKPVNEKTTTLITLEHAPYPQISNLGLGKNKYWVGEPINLLFQVSNPQEIKAVEIYQNTTKIKSITLDKLKSVCQTTEQGLSCQTPLKVSTSGDYSYSAKIISKNPAQYYSKEFTNIEAKNPISVAEKPIDLKIDNFSINGQYRSPISVPVTQDAIIEWKVTGKNVTVSISGMGQDLPPQGSLKQTAEALKPFQGQTFNLTLTATDKYGKPKTAQIFGKYNTLPTPTPTPTPTF